MSDWARTSDSVRRKRVLEDGRVAIAARQPDGRCGVRLARRLVLEGYDSVEEACADFDANEHVLIEVDTTGKASRPVIPCSNDEGHHYMLPKPEKGNGGWTQGTCKHCGETRTMTNIEGKMSPTAWNSGLN